MTKSAGMTEEDQQDGGVCYLRGGEVNHRKDIAAQIKESDKK